MVLVEQLKLALRNKAMMLESRMYRHQHVSAAMDN
jgi:hypothetical protein